MDLCLSLLERQSLFNQRRAEQVGEANASRARTQEQVLLVTQFCALDLRSVDHAREYDSRSTLHVVVVDAVLVAITLKQMDGVDAGPILEVNAALREDLLYRFDEFVNKGIQVFRRGAIPAEAQIQWIVQVLFIIRASIEIHRKQILWRHSSAGGIQLQLANGDASTVCAEITETENAAAVCNADDPDILL